MRPETAALARVIQRLAAVGDDALAALLALTSVRQAARDSYLLRAGERAELCFFLARGLARELYVDAHGVEHTRSFVEAGQLTGSLRDLLSSSPAVTFIHVLEPSTVVAFSYGAFDGLCARFPELHVVARRQAERLYVKKTEREYEMLALSARERYECFCAQHEDLHRRVTRRHLASYLGITPEHLSRLRHARG